MPVPPGLVSQDLFLSKVRFPATTRKDVLTSADLEDG